MARHRAVFASLVLVGGAVLAGCGDNGGERADESSCDPADSTVTVHGLDNLKFDSEAYEASTGCIELQYVNDGNVAHTLLVDGYDFKLTIGKTDEGRIELEPGTYRLYCDIAGHERAGMVAELIVT